MENQCVDILFHPTGRRIQKREAIAMDVDAVIKAAVRNGTILEIDAHPERLDLKTEHVRKAVNAGARLSIDSDAHSADGFKYLEYGIGQARRGWAGKKDVVNTESWQEMKKMLK